MTDKIPRKRVRKYIDRKTQGRIALIVVINAMLYIILLALLIFAPLAYRIYTNELTPEIQQAAQAFLTLHVYFWPAMLVVLIVMTVHSILLSHLLAGPVYRFKQTLLQMRRGDFSIQITLRKKDFFFDMMDEMNQTNQNLFAFMTDLKEKNLRIRETIEEMKHLLNQQGLPVASLKNVLDAIDNKEKALSQGLEAFHLKDDV